MTAMLPCACGCGRSFEASKRKRKYFDVRAGSSCRQRAWRSRWLRRVPARRNTGSLVPLQRIPSRVYSRRYIEVGSVRRALAAIAQDRPDIFRRFLASVEALNA